MCTYTHIEYEDCMTRLICKEYVYVYMCKIPVDNSRYRYMRNEKENLAIVSHTAVYCMRKRICERICLLSIV